MATDKFIPGKVLGEQRRVYMGLGEAVLRLIHVELLYATNSGVEAELVTERNLIVQALNQQYQLDLGFDCNADAVPDTVEIFQQTAKTSCCRILPMGDDDSDSGRKEKFGSGRRVENLPDIEKVKENLADFMTKAPLAKPAESPLESKPKSAPKPVEKPPVEKPVEKAPEPEVKEKPKGAFLSRAIEKAFGKSEPEPKKERGVRKSKENKE
jgi:hypothetical protein